MLNCIVSFEKLAESNKCGSDSNAIISTVARKMTADVAPSIINNAYFKPSYRNPYYSISIEQNVETDLDKIIDPCNFVENDKGNKINLYIGKVKYEPTKVFVTYLKTPKKYYLTDDDLYGEDLTEQLEFPEYVCYEIINEFVKLLLENTSDPRLQTNVPINQTILPQASE